jgi:hypothetical protein
MKILSQSDEFHRDTLMLCKVQQNRWWCFRTIGALLFIGLIAFISDKYMQCERLEACAFSDEKKGRDFDCERQVLSEHCFYKRVLIQELSSGQITLKDASAVCLQIDDNWPRVMANIRRCFTGNSDLEKEARCLAFIASRRPMNTDARILLVERLGAEFRELFPAAPDLSLPDST